MNHINFSDQVIQEARHFYADLAIESRRLMH